MCTISSMRQTAPAGSPSGSPRPTRKAQGPSRSSERPPCAECVRGWKRRSSLRRPLFRRVRRGNVLGPGRLSARSHPDPHRAACRAGRRGGPGVGALAARRSGAVARRGRSERGRDAGGGPLAVATMPGRYARGELAARGAVARLRYGQRLSPSHLETTHGTCRAVRGRWSIWVVTTPGGAAVSRELRAMAMPVWPVEERR